MYIISDYMKSTADYAIKVAKDRFKHELDFSEQSIAKLENILEQIYWGFSNHTKSDSEDGVILNTAIIWGSYLGEYMRLKMGGIWILKGSDPLVLIKNTEFSPINLVYQKITSHPEYSVEKYLNETKSIINTAGITPKQSEPKPESISQSEKQIPIKQTKKPVTIDKRLIFALMGVGGLLLVILFFLIGYKIIKTGTISAFGVKASPTSSNTNIPLENPILTATAFATNTQAPTVTLLPTYTPVPTVTPHPTFTPSLTHTPIATLIPTETQTPVVLTPTRTPTKSRTPGPIIPTDTHIPQTEGPTLTPTPRPLPTDTVPPPVNINSCEINPSSVPPGFNVTITFIVHFSAPGYGFDSSIQANNPDQSDCSGTDSNGDGTAQCDGSSGLLPDSTKVDVILRSSVGECTVSFSSP
jgi:hypothetical protein